MKKFIYISIYTLLIFLAILFPGFSDLIEAIINMSRNTISFSKLEVNNILFSDASLHILGYLILCISLTFLYVISITINTIYLSNMFSEYLNKKIIYISLPILCNIGCLQLNALLFPNSTHSYSRLVELSDKDWLSAFFVSILFLGVFTKFLTSGIKFIQKNYKNTSLVLVSILAFIGIYAFKSQPSITAKDYKHVFIIGIDSFRFDHMHDNMPFLKEKLDSSLVFENSFTPFARTFPSWSTILSGQYPMSHGARYNLIDEENLNKTTNYLPKILSSHGYETIYASDERRFSQIGKFHGFDTIIGPRTGLSNMILGQFADFPLTNFLTLFERSHILMPDITLNRAASNTYSPDVFSSQVNKKIKLSLNKGKPIFASIHYCMPHWPFNHGRSLVTHNHEDSSAPGYHSSLNTVDNQINILWDFLEENKLIKNSIIVFLSDHGESWEEQLLFTSKDRGLFTLKSHGHGSNIISDNEYRVLTAFFNKNLYPTTNTTKTTTLADIKPTILNILKINDENSDGEDLFSKSHNNNNNKLLPIESGFNISAITHKNININKVLEQSAARYTIRKNGTIRIKNEEIPFLDDGKRVGVRTNNKIITYQSINKEAPPEMFILTLDTNTIEFLKPQDDYDHPLVISMCKFHKKYILDSGFCLQHNT